MTGFATTYITPDAVWNNSIRSLTQIPASSETETIGADLAAGRGTTITAGASANVKGSYVQLEPLTSKAAHGLIVNVSYAASVWFIVDVAIGEAGSEVNVVESLFLACVSGTTQPIVIPVEIPAGSRISARCQASQSSATFDLTCVLLE
jgi:hypothetical protein